MWTVWHGKFASEVGMEKQLVKPAVRLRRHWQRMKSTLATRTEEKTLPGGYRTVSKVQKVLARVFHG